MKSKKTILFLLFIIVSFSAISQVDTISSSQINNDYLSPAFQTINYDSIIQQYYNAEAELEQRKNEIEKLETQIETMNKEIVKMDSLNYILNTQNTTFSEQLIKLQNQYYNDTNRLSLEIDELRTNGYNLKKINDTLAKLNEEYRSQINDKNRLLEEKIKILQEKEMLFAEKEKVYKDAISNSNIDKAKIEGLVQASNAKIDGKEKEINLLQKNINEKETSITSKDLRINKITEEKEMYYKMADTLRSKLVEAEKQLLKINEELKYTKQRAEEAEARVAAATNKKKKVRVIQGIAMRFFPTPDWDIVPRDNGIGGYENIIINRNSSKVEFDFVTGATVMLYDLTKPESKFSSDVAVYVGFGGANLFKNFYFGGAYRFLDFFHVSAGVNVAEYTLLAENFNKEGDALKPGWSIQTTKEWKVTPFICLSLDLEFLTYMGKK